MLGKMERKILAGLLAVSMCVTYLPMGVGQVRAAEESTPEESIVVESTPEESTVVESTPEENTVVESTPEESIVVESNNFSESQ